MSVTVRGVSFGYRADRPLLHHVDLAVEDGNRLFILGANGSGKSTLLRLIAAIHRPWRGEIRIDGRSSRDLGPRGRAQRLAVVPQSDLPLHGYTVNEVVVMGRAAYLSFFSRPTRTDWSVVEKALTMVGIESLAERPYDAISGGERQLVLIARGLAQGARTLLLDEPDAHLDPAYQQRVLSSLSEIAMDDHALIITSHHPNNALLFADEVSFLIAGRTTVPHPPERALNADWLEAAYGVAFDGIREGNALRALIPRGMSRR
jgi:iron complex transport system ATP-binding protein